jgi:hypothetical protein
MPHGQVWVVGQKPARAFRDVRWIAVDEGPRKWDNLPRAILAAAKCSDISDEFVLMNDDFFVMRPVLEPPKLHRGRTADQRRDGRYGKGYVETDMVLAQLGVIDPLSYELHVPLLVEKASLRDALERGLALHRGGCLHTRTLYGNLFGQSGRQAADVKVYSERRDTWPADATFLSTNATSWSGACGRAIRAAFTEPCRHE